MQAQQEAFPTAWTDGHRVLYHWQRLNENRLAEALRTGQIYCSSPGAFNDPWDCKPHFNTRVLEDPEERRRHAGWAVALCRRRTNMSAPDLERMHEELVGNPARAAQVIEQLSAAMAQEINERYRVYCLGPDPTNLLMWSHYAEDHKGVCLEFDLRNDVMCAALRCEYLKEYPIFRVYEDDERVQLLTLLAKSDVWHYEQEYRLVAQERGQAIAEADTLVTDGSKLQLPAGALRAVITGCQADHERVRALVHANAPHVSVKRAVRVPNRYELIIEAQ